MGVNGVSRPRRKIEKMHTLPVEQEDKNIRGAKPELTSNFYSLLDYICLTQICSWVIIGWARPPPKILGGGGHKPSCPPPPPPPV